MRKFILLFMFVLFISSINAQIEVNDQSANNHSNDLTLLVSYMQGSFSSEEQSKSDTDYFDIRLQMKRIWCDRSDAIWIYVEQAVSSKLDKPYRQRVYKLVPLKDGIIESSVFTFPDPLKYAGDWKKDEPLNDLTPDDLISRIGCSVYLSKTENGSFVGSTKGKECESELRGAKYAISEAVIYNNGLNTWERGFNDKDEQVWGATKGGYMFKKISD